MDSAVREVRRDEECAAAAPPPPAATDPSSHPSPSKRARTKPPPPAALPSTSSTSTSSDGAALPSSPVVRLTAKERDQLGVVVESLAPPVVLEQQLSGVAGWEGKTLRDVLGTVTQEGQGLEMSVLRAALSSASTSALLSSTLLAFDSTGQDESAARLLNEIDDFGRTVGGVVDGLERKALEGEGGKGVKREAEEDTAQEPPASKSRKYMLHRSLATGVDLFTSGAILSEADLAELAKVEDTDLVLLTPSSSSVPPAPAPSLGSTLPPALPPSSLFPSAPYSAFTSPQPLLERFGLAPAQVHKRARAAAVAAAAAAAGGAAQPEAEGSEEGAADGETELLYYGTFASFAPAFDSRDAVAGRGYTASASRALRDKRVRRWESEALDAPALTLAAPGADAAGAGKVDLSKEEREVLASLGVSDLPAFQRALRAAEGEHETWKRLEEVARLVERVGGRQVARIASAGRKGKGKGGVKSEEEGEGEEVVGEAEREEATALLTRLASLISHHSLSPSARLVPPPGALSAFTPLFLASSPALTTTREPSYYGTLDEVNYRAVREGAMSGGASAAGANGIEVDGQ
ncbi:hypothetical protein JCM6882_008535 [Rhodosporidiobolus microsporus]